MTHTAAVAVVLAGGRSSRFGTDKLVAIVDGEPLLHLAIRAVDDVADHVIVVAAPHADLDLPSPSTLRPGASIDVVHDFEPFGGPVAALRSAAPRIRDAGSGEDSIALVVGGDMPYLQPAVLRALVARLDGDGRPDAAVLVDDEARPRPLPLAARSSALLRAVNEELARGGRSLRGALARLRIAAIPAAEWRQLDPAGTTLRDIDRPDDIDRPGDIEAS
jgi:molybdopterin-guanine dinucleotide biosynthesis protein A